MSDNFFEVFSGWFSCFAWYNGKFGSGFDGCDGHQSKPRTIAKSNESSLCTVPRAVPTTKTNSMRLRGRGNHSSRGTVKTKTAVATRVHTSTGPIQLFSFLGSQYSPKRENASRDIRS